MRYLLITYPNLEFITKQEIEEIIGPIDRGLRIERSVVLVDLEFEDYLRLLYQCQSVFKIMPLLQEIEFKDIDDLTEKIEVENIARYINSRYVIKCKRKGKHNFQSVDVIARISKRIKGKIHDFHNFDQVIYIFIYDNKCYVCLDISVIDLDKRYYRVFTHPSSIKGQLAYALLRLGTYSKEKILVDPYCRSGEIVIEAAHYCCGMPINYFNKDKIVHSLLKNKEFFKYNSINYNREHITAIFREIDSKITKPKVPKIFGYDSSVSNINCAKKNASIANVEDCIKFARCDVSFLDLKLKAKSVDCIITQPSHITKRRHSSKELSSLLEVIKYSLKREGKAVLLTKDSDNMKELLDAYKEFNYSYHRLEVGDIKYNILIISKTS